MADYIPPRDGNFLGWEQNFLTVATANVTALGLVAGDLTPVTAGQTAFEEALTNHQAAQALAQSATAGKNDTRDALEDAIRVVVRKIQANPTVSNELKQQLGITAEQGRSPAPTPESRPVAEVEEVEGLTQVLRLTDSASGKRAKPYGVRAIEARMAIGTTPPADPEQMPIVGYLSSGKLVMNFAGTEAGKTAWYAFRYVNAADEKGPFSTVVPATIAA